MFALSERRLFWTGVPCENNSFALCMCHRRPRRSAFDRTESSPCSSHTACGRDRHLQGRHLLHGRRKERRMSRPSRCQRVVRSRSCISYPYSACPWDSCQHSQCIVLSFRSRPASNPRHSQSHYTGPHPEPGSRTARRPIRRAAGDAIDQQRSCCQRRRHPRRFRRSSRSGLAQHLQPYLPLPRHNLLRQNQTRLLHVRSRRQSQGRTHRPWPVLQ
jgi:hypothetical protein